MYSVCIWCKREMEPSSCNCSDSIIGEGICRECSENLLFQMGVDIQRFLDSLSAPIILIGAEGVIRAGNIHARMLLGKELQDKEKQPIGEAFECEYSRLPGGCGKTIHCSGCTIRRTFTETFTTGRMFQRVPAYLHRESRTINLFISTERVGEIILLRIDEVG